MRLFAFVWLILWVLPTLLLGPLALVVYALTLFIPGRAYGRESLLRIAGYPIYLLGYMQGEFDRFAWHPWDGDVDPLQ